MEKREEKINKKKIEAIVKSEKEKWASLKKHQEEKKIKANRAKYDKFLVKEPNLMRILIIGESFSGKTCLIKRYIKDEFNFEYKTTLSIEAFKSELLFYEDATYRIELIDTPPLENFYKYLDEVLYFVQGIIIVFDASNKNAFLRMLDYFKMINFYNFQKIGIVASKKDICTENDKYKFYQLQKFCEQYNCLPCFLSSKNSKEDIKNFLDKLCPEIIPSLVNKKENLKLMYPYTKSIKNDFPKKNAIDEAIIKKAKEDDSSYESEHSQSKEKNREEEIKEFYLKKKKGKERKKIEIKQSYIYNIGNINKKFQENDDNSNYDYEEKKEELQSFNNVIGNVNIDLEKLFQKYRPDSSYSKKATKNNKKYNNKKNKTVEADRDWVNVNIDSLIEEFLNTKKGFKKKDKKGNKSNNENKSNNKSNKKSNRSKQKEEEKAESKLSKGSKKSKIDEENKKDESIKSKNDEEKKNIENEKENNDIEGEKESKEQNNNNEESEKNKKSEGERQEKDNNNDEENKKNEGDSEEKRNNSEEKNDNDNSEYYEDLYRDIYNFQQNAIKEAMGEQEQNE